MSLENGSNPFQRDIQFTYQRGSRYEPFVEQGISPNLEESSFCWLACLDMAFSRFMNDPEIRLDALSEVVERVRSEEMLGNKGQLFIFDSFFEKFVEIAAESAEKVGLPVTVHSTDRSVNELVYEVDVNGAMVLFAVTSDVMAHAMLMDSVEKNDSGEIIAISYLNPIKQSSEEARGVITLGQVPEKGKIGNIRINPDKIVFSPHNSLLNTRFPQLTSGI